MQRLRALKKYSLVLRVPRTERTHCQHCHAELSVGSMVFIGDQLLEKGSVKQGVKGVPLIEVAVHEVLQ